MSTLPITDEVIEEKEILPGAQLATIRENKGLTKEYVAGKLHLRLQIVELLEQDEYLKLPEAVFIKGYLRGYAKLLNVSPEPYLQAFNNQVFHEKPEKALWQGVKESNRNETMIRWITGLIVLSAIVSGGVWWQKEKNAQLSALSSKESSAKATAKNDANESLTDTAQMQSLFLTPASENADEKIDG